MSTVLYRSGEAGTLGFPIDDPTGRPMPTAGLAARMIVYCDGPDLVVPGRWSSGELLIDGRRLDHPSIMAFDIDQATIPLRPRLYKAVLQINDGAQGWQTLPGGDFNLQIRRL